MSKKLIEVLRLKKVVKEIVGEFEEILQRDPSVARRLLEEKIAEIRQRQEETPAEKYSRIRMK